MTTDIIERLRDRGPPPSCALQDEAATEIERLRGLLERCKTVLSNMALENEGAVFNRWPINHEPLRADARGLLSEMAALDEQVAK